MEERLEYRIFTYSAYLLNKFGKKVFRIGLSTGKPCPHRIENGGCIFCNPNTFTGEYQSQNFSIKEQYTNAIPRVKKACGDVQLLAYFQDETSTYGDIEFLKQKFDEALSHPEVIGLVVSTRPDYINAEVVKLLASYEVPVTIEIGMQSIHNKSLELLNRGHTFEQVEESIRICGEAGLTVGVHLILGIPNETFSEMLQTIKWISSNKYISQVKFHNLVVYKNTKLAQMKNIPIYPIEEHIKTLGKLIPYLRGNIAVSRLFTSNIRRTQIAVDEYKGNKTQWINSLRKYLYENNLNQGNKTDMKYDFRKYYK
ncbi:MAG: TIGR01212 family radical SAM protein [Candidatus Tenebribacter mawsonii]|nr:TIGR01212 family radical SAM protein [Candidatus Tenebribacter mawsonii]